jgi:ribose transport system substrate-binding protein
VWNGYGIADTVNRALAGEEQVAQGIGWQTIDADHNLPASGGYVAPVDYKSAYRTLWGLK